MQFVAGLPGVGKDIRISGCLVVRDGILHGYPFVEVIQAALPACDEFLISDGYSTDGTWQALSALRDAYPQRIRLHRDAWPRDDIASLVEVTTRLLRRCRFDYCLNLQANEVLHEDTCDEIRSLPERYPSTEMFRLPFLNLMGRSLAWFVDFRRRLFRNRPHIVAVGDAYDVGYRALGLWRQPRTLLRYALHRTGERVVYLRKPVYRYRALFPTDYLRKLETRQRLLKTSDCPELDHARALWRTFDPRTASPAAFWAAMRPYFDDVMWRQAPDRWPDTPRRCLAWSDAADCPTLMRPLFDAWEYPIADSLARLRALRAAKMAGEDL